MCGLTGFLWKNSSSTFDAQNQLKAMTNSILHRGPDDEGFWIDKPSRIAIGHRRLSVLDLSSAGHQPMHSHSSRFVIAFNGEIYNHISLREDLEIELMQPINWKGHSDTETLLYCFEQWGIDITLEKITGMFSISLFDKELKDFYLIRDRMGEKPIYYGWVKNHFIFGSELKALKEFDNFSQEVDPDALALFLKYSYVPAPFTIYKNIEKLTQGTYLKLSMIDDSWSHNNLSLNQYWKMEDIAKSGNQENKYSDSEDNAIEELEKLLSKSVKRQMISDVSLGAFLSGGIDSSLIVALMQKQSNKKVKTFTIGFNEDGFNEADEAIQIAKYLDTDHTELYVNPEDAMNVINKLPKIYDEPFADSSQIPTFLVSQLAREHVTVSLSGDGGDEMFGGYTRYFMANRVWKNIHKIPLPFRKIISKVISFFSPSFWNYFFNNMFKILPSQYRVTHPADKLYKLSKILISKDIYEVYDNLVSHWSNPFEVVLNSNNAIQKQKNYQFLDHENEMMLRDSNTYLPDDILVKVDRAAMSVSLETRTPFLDKNVVEFAWQLPLNMKIKNSQGKWILRKVLDKYIPKELIDRPKMGFGVPIDLWLRGPLKEWAEELLSEKRLEHDGYFNVQIIRTKWLEHLSGNQNWQYHLWNVLMFQIWLDEQ
jgi:asparagine synthase (glutamine-hydrolysing)